MISHFSLRLSTFGAQEGALLRISYCKNFEKREIRENMFSHRLHGWHRFIFNHELLELRSTAAGKVNCSNFSFIAKVFENRQIRENSILTDDRPVVCFIVNKGLILFDES